MFGDSETEVINTYYLLIRSWVDSMVRYDWLLIWGANVLHQRETGITLIHTCPYVIRIKSTYSKRLWVLSNISSLVLGIPKWRRNLAIKLVPCTYYPKGNATTSWRHDVTEALSNRAEKARHWTGLLSSVTHGRCNAPENKNRNIT